jgi:hypothetical protein
LQPQHLRVILPAGGTGKDPCFQQAIRRPRVPCDRNVSHTERGNSIRIISARLATRTERKIYEKG